MSNTKILKNYLLEKDNAFLLDDTNNGKTIMLSGAWGAGKTHFWQNEIEEELAIELKEKACVYVSLYGKESISDVKSSIFLEAYKSVYGEDLISKTVSRLNDVAKVLGKGKNVDAFNKLNQEEKEHKSKELLENGSVICLDDFERKSNKIDLNDLFGLISDLALSLKCKIIIILNSNVFQGKEAEVFRRVKEKTVNKFFYFKPTIDELFESISSNKKYSKLDEYKEDILKAIKETEELNARIYIQVLDNCLEWYNSDKECCENIIRFLVLGNINFILNHLVFETEIIEIDENESNRILNQMASLNSQSRTQYPYQEKIVQKIEIDIKLKDNKEYIELYGCIENNYRSENFIDLVVKNIKNNSNKTIKENNEFYIDYVYSNQNIIRSLSFLKFFNIYKNNIKYKDTFNEIANFIESGILS